MGVALIFRNRPKIFNDIIQCKFELYLSSWIALFNEFGEVFVLVDKCILHGAPYHSQSTQFITEMILTTFVQLFESFFDLKREREGESMCVSKSGKGVREREINTCKDICMCVEGKQLNYTL